MPQRIEVALSSEATAARPGEPVSATVQADFLYGAPASGLMIEGGVTLKAADAVEGYSGYTFGLASEPVTPERAPLFDLPRTGADGRARVAVPIPQSDRAGTARVAEISVRVREPGGRQVEDTLTLPVLDGSPLIGIRPEFDGSAPDNATAAFSVIALDGAREPVAMDADWTLTRLQRSFQWYQRDGRWFYEPVERREAVASGTAAISGSAPALIEAPVVRGRYRLEVRDPTDARIASSVTFRAGWASGAAAADTPDVLEVHLDRETYRAGDTATLTINAERAGKALVTVMSNTLHDFRLVDVPAGGTDVTIPVEADWTPGVYVSATLFNPSRDGADARPLPDRAVGLAWLDVDTASRRLEVAVDAPGQVRGNRDVRVPVTVSGLAPDETAHLTVAAVDAGILNVTGFTPPDVDGHFLGQRRLGVEIRDLYGDLIDSSGGVRGRVRSGGDGPSAGTEALPPNEEPVALFTGVIETDSEGRAIAEFDVPAFDGTLEVMAVAWTGTAVGDASAEMVVRDPVIVAGSMPRFIAPGDETRIRFDLHNVAHSAGEYRLSVSATGPVELGRTEASANLSRNQRGSLVFPMTATGVGESALTARLTGPDGLSITRDYTIVARPAAAEATERQIVALPPGETTTLSATLLDGFDTDAAVTLSVGAGDLDTAGLLMLLDRFPYGCAEQTVSRALPLLYLDDVAADIGLDADIPTTERIDGAIRRVLAFQSSSGGFGLWSPGTDLWLTAYVTDFLSRAREAGHGVPGPALEAALDRLQSVLSYTDNVEGERGGRIAYATYVLARNGRAAIGDVRYLAEEKLSEIDSPLARAQLAASLAFTGDTQRADRIFRNAVSLPATRGQSVRSDFGTALRDAAAVVTLAAEAGVSQRTVESLSADLSRLRTADRSARSTQEAAWLLLAANATRPTSGSVTVDGTPLEAPLHRSLSRRAVEAGVRITNEGSAPVAVAATVAGTPLEPRAATASGITIERTFHTLDGVEVSPETVDQNTRLLVRLTLQRTATAPMRLLLTDLLPAGFEIENPRLVASAEVAAMPFAELGPRPEYVAFRDDRFAAAWTLSGGDEGRHEPISVTYMVRAISPGTFTLPAAEAMAMYQPQYVARTPAGTVSVIPTR